MKVKMLSLLFFLLCSLSIKTYAQEDMFKALFMYNFTKDIEWPSSYTQGDFVITVLGSSGIVTELEKIAEKKKVGTQSIKIFKVSNPGEIPKSHIVYIAESKSSLLAGVNSTTNGKPVVIITDKPGLANQGSGINYVKIDGKQKFEINPTNITNRGLKVNSFLLSLGIVVN